ncbi:antistasin-like [Watersipora subatra]|uniref:antistasin-like n=1 Tax=Watersipora subatra TaxID=2589382 RepID=UPI00355B74D4
MSLAKALIFVALITTISAAVTCPQCPVNDCGLLPPEFRYECPNGNILDECGCVESCLCAGCPPFDTSLPCPNGKEVDANMCPLTECKFCPLCPVNDCGLLLPEFRYECPNGNILDECGCVASCLCAGCPPFNTSLPCPNGKKVDANMCPISECKPPTCEFAGDCAAVTCEAGVGNAVDEEGCPLRGCPCRGSADCPPLVGCSLDCSTQGGYGRDANRCVICECAGCPPFTLDPSCNDLQYSTAKVLLFVTSTGTVRLSPVLLTLEMLLMKMAARYQAVHAMLVEIALCLEDAQLTVLTEEVTCLTEMAVSPASADREDPLTRVGVHALEQVAQGHVRMTLTVPDTANAAKRD